MSNILVTGGEGFIGHSLAKFLANTDRHNVFSVDNHFNKNKNIKRHSRIKYYTMDCQDLPFSELNLINFDYIFHLGEYSRVQQSFKDYDTVMEYNYHTFPTVLKFAKDRNAKLIYSGSSTKFATYAEDYIQSPYAYTKAQNTELLKNFASWNDLDYSIVYFYNVYGQGENGQGEYATVVQKYIDMVKAGATKLPVTSPGTQLRNFTYIADIISGLVFAAFHGSGDGYGIGSPEKYSVLDLVEMLGCEPDMQPSAPGNRMDGELKTDKLEALGWTARETLKNYIEKTL